MEHIKTFLLGVLVAVVVTMLIGAGASSSRYQIAGAGGTSYYILDTYTGKIVAAGGNDKSGAASRAVETQTRFLEDY